MTAHSVLGPFQTAVYSRLTGDSALMALITGVFDDVPEKQPFDYVTFGESTEQAWDCFGQDGSEVAFDLHIWSRYRGFAKAQAIAAAIIGLLNNGVALTITGYGTVLLDYVSTQQLRDPDGITRHLVTRFQLLADVT